MLLSSGKDEDGIGWWFFQSLQEGIEGLRTQHMHLINDVYFVFTLLRGEADLVGQFTDVVDGVIAGSIQFKYIERAIIAKTCAIATGAAGFHVCGWMLAIDGFGQDTGTSSFTHASRPAKEIGMSQMLVADRIFKGGGNMLLSHNGIKRCRAVFPGRNYVFTHLNQH